MKQNYLFLIMILNVCFAVLSMEDPAKATTSIAEFEITRMVQPLIDAGRYDEAFEQLNTLSPEKQATNRLTIQKLKKKIEEQMEEQMENARQAANRGEYDEAYWILEALMNQGSLAANKLREEIKKKREAEPPTAQQIAQEQNLKNALARLTSSLKSITKYLPSITRPRTLTSQFLPETMCLPPLTRTRSKPGGRMPLPKEPRPSPVKPDQSTPLKGPAADIAKALENAYAAIVNQRATKTYNNVVYYLKQNDLYPKNLTIDEEKELATRIRELAE